MMSRTKPLPAEIEREMHKIMLNLWDNLKLGKSEDQMRVLIHLAMELARKEKGK